MNVWLNVGGGQGYDFVINRSRGENRANVERLTGESAQTVGEAAYAVSGKTIQFTLPRSLLGDITSLQLKATDNVDLLADIMVLYTTGDSAPYGRLNYCFEL